MRLTSFASTCALLSLLLLAGCGQSDEPTRERFSGNEEVAMYQAAMNILGFLPSDFDYTSMVLYKDEDRGMVGVAHRGEKGFMVGNSVNMNLMTTCEIYEPVLVVDGVIQFSRTSCEAVGTLQGSELKLSNMSDCGFCGMGASIDGTFARFAEIVYDYKDGRPSVKQVYKLN